MLNNLHYYFSFLFYLVYVWIGIIFLRLAFCVLLFFLMHVFQLLGDKVHCSCTVHAMFTGPTTTLLRKKY